MKREELEEKLEGLCHSNHLTHRDKNGIILAREMFKLSPYNEIHIGASIMKKKKVLALGVNQPKTHPRQQMFNKLRDGFKPNWKGFLHAEMDALRHVDNPDDLIGSTIYVYREHHDGKFGMCRPCKACMAAIKKSGIKTIIYTSRDGICKEVLV